MKTIKSFILTLLFFNLVFLTGCYFSEMIETRILLGSDGMPSRVVITYTNISSGEEMEKDVRKDFEQLIKDWKEDGYLLERLEDGFLVKNREVFIKNEQINGREDGIIKDINQLYEFWVNKGERIMIFDDEDYDLVESNGKILKTNKNTLIVWSEDEKELYWKQKLNDEVEDFDRNRKVMLQWLKEYLKKQEAG